MTNSQSNQCIQSQASGNVLGYHDNMISSHARLMIMRHVCLQRTLHNGLKKDM